ncbi:preprotein translocase subunit SecY [Eubacteriales bacterium OttesenSCG-928-N13]|nr:preprotein translocase subunit SecY [Eubacteriales bacterium OttesenSCG-928-N13]
MWQTLRNAWKIIDLRKKLLYTLGMLLLYRVLCFVPTPGVNLEALQQAVSQYDILVFMNMMTGSAIDQFNIMAMGITPYINASIIMQLLTVAIPKLEQLQKEGEEGRKKIAQYTRYATIALGFIQAVALSRGLGASAAGTWDSYITIGVCLAAGTAMAMWIGERITTNGIGNGISLLIFAGIISRIAGAVASAVMGIFNQTSGTMNIFSMLIVVVLSLIMIIAVVFVDLGERRVPVQYAKRMVGRKMYGGQSTHIPLRVNSTGVLPLIFASAIMQFPGTIMAFWPNSSASQWWTAHFNFAGAPYQILFALLIFGFTYFYTAISFNPADISKNIQQNGGMIPGIRQGKPTTDYLHKISNRITLFGAVFLALLATIPTALSAVAGLDLPFAASSLLIAVSVAMETTRQLESQMLMRHYKGFLK